MAEVAPSRVSSSEIPGSAPDPTVREVRRVALASLIGTTIEWYDFLIYGTMAGIVFNEYFFPTGHAFVSTMLAYATFAVGFIVRPLGGLVFGHFGDRIGRKPLLVLTIMIMGLATFLIGFIPTYASIGIAAPLALLGLRIVQGFAIGGEWGGAVLMAYEFSPKNKRAYYASFPQVGLAIGLCLGTGVLTFLSSVMSDAAFISWGWRIAFWVSILLLGVGLYIRWQLVESPEFAATKAEHEVEAVPAVAVVRDSKRDLALGVGARLIDGIIFTIYAIFTLTLLVGQVKIPRTVVLAGITAAAFTLIFTIPLASRWADQVGPRKLYVVFSIILGLTGFPALALMQYSGSDVVAVIVIVVVLGVLYAPVYGPQAAIFCELFETRLRYTGTSLVYQIGAIVSVSLTPLVATALLKYGDNKPWWIALYITAAGFVSAACVAKMGDPVE